MPDTLVPPDAAPHEGEAPPRPAGRGTMILADTIGQAWIEVARLILRHGRPSDWEGLPLREVELVTLDIGRPSPEDALIARHASPDWLAWMRANFTLDRPVAELGGARSYASRLTDYAGTGRDQIAWLADKLRRDRVTSNAAITTFEPLTDTVYIPCVSLIDAWLRQGRLELVAYAHSIDFGKKGYGNLVQLAEIQATLAERLDVPAGRLAMVVKSAHLYDTELDAMAGIVAAAG